MQPPPELRARIVAALSRIYLPKCQLNAWQFCEKHISIDPEESRDNHGLYSTADMLYIRRVFEFVTNPGEKELIVMKSAQLGFTLAYMLIICFLAATAPTHVLYAMHSAKKAKEISTRLQRLFKKNKALSDCLTGEPEETLQNLLLKLQGMVVVLTGSGSTGEFDASSFGFVNLDELDRHKPGTNESANTIDLARTRIKEVASGKLIAGGTPEDYDGETNQNFLTGTREEIYVPCPFCGTYQPLRFEQLRFAHCKNARGDYDYDRILKETYHDCITPGCSTPTTRILNKHKRPMLQCGRWTPTNTGADEHKPFPERVSIWVNDLYSTREKNTWGHIARDFIGAQKSPSKLRKFNNHTLGRPRPDKALRITTHQVARLAGGYEHGCMPVSPATNSTGLAAIVLFADVQATCKKWTKAGFTRDGQMYVIDYGQCLTYDDLNEIADRPVFVGMTYPSPADLDAAKTTALASGEALITVLRRNHPGEWHTDIAMGGIDEGNGGDTTAVRTWCLANAIGADAYGNPIPRFYPTKGVAVTSVKDVVDEVAEKFKIGEQFITVYHYSDSDMKHELYTSRIGDFDNIRAGKSHTPRLHLPANPDPGYLDELSQEQREETTYRGKRMVRWVDPKGINDYGDATKCCLVLWEVIKKYFDNDTPLARAPEAPPTPDPQTASEQPLTDAPASDSDSDSTPYMDDDGRIHRASSE